MTKEQFLDKWRFGSNPLFEADFEAVIATEIAKVQPEKQNTMVQEKQLRELFKYIEANWGVCVEDIDKRDIKRIFGGVLCEDIMNDTLHEVKDEQPAKPFDKDRFEAMFRAVVASGVEWEYDNIFGWITDAIKKLDAYYAEKEGGANG